MADDNRFERMRQRAEKLQTEETPPEKSSGRPRPKYKRRKATVYLSQHHLDLVDRAYQKINAQRVLNDLEPIDKADIFERVIDEGMQNIKKIAKDFGVE